MRALSSRNQNAARRVSTRNSTVPSALVLQLEAEGDRRDPHADPQRLAEQRRGRFLDELLVPPLHRAVPVAEMDHVLAVAEQLHLDVPGGGDVPFQVHPRIPERRLRLGAGHRDRLSQLQPGRGPPAAPGLRRRLPP